MKKIYLLITILLLAGLTSVQPASADNERDPEIVGGSNADFGEYPWMVAIGNPNGNGIQQWCGGSLIHPEWVLTAAHCMEGETAGGLRVVIGLHQLSNAGSEGETRSVTQIIAHPNYDDNTYDYDMALLKLNAPSTAETILPVFANETTLTASGVMATVTGWGDTTEGGTGSNILQEVSIPLVSNATCNALSSYNGDITARDDLRRTGKRRQRCLPKR